MQKHSHVFPPDERDLEVLSELFQALSDKTRLSILLYLHQAETHVGDIQQALGLPQSTISRHLSLLRSAQLVHPERRGAQVFYSLRSNHVGRLLEEAFFQAQHQRLGLPDHLGPIDEQKEFSP